MILDSYGQKKSMQRARCVQLQCVTNREKKKELNLLLDVGTEKYMMSSDASLTGY